MKGSAHPHRYFTSGLLDFSSGWGRGNLYCNNIPTHSRQLTRKTVEKWLCDWNMDVKGL